MGLFSKFKNALKKTKESLSKKMFELFATGKIGDDFFDELEEILISSDISVATSMEIVDYLREEVVNERCKDKDYVISLLKEKLIEILNEAPPLEIQTPAVIMVIGVNGVGKTTSIGKLASAYSKEKKSVTIAAADTFRAAASDQLSVWADRAKVKIVKNSEGADPSAVVFDAISSIKAKNGDVLIIDTAGRLHVKEHLMKELEKMDRVVKREFPQANFYKVIALDATTGQNAYNQVSVFNEAVGLDGIILTKLDGTAKGGFVISLCGELGVPVFKIGTGEGIDDISDFNVEDFVEELF